MSVTESNSLDMNTHPPQSNQELDEVIIQLYPNDVLFGRGSGPNDHEGNIRFRLLVGERKEEYMATNHRQTKAKIAREIVNQVLALNGRFLKKVEPADAKRRGIPKGVDAWLAADDETIMEKAKQALRQHREKGGEKTPTGSPVPQPKATQTPPKMRLENFSVNPPYGIGFSRPAEIHVPTMSRVVADQPRSSGYADSSMMQPNPYEPIPFQQTCNDPSAPLDWREYPTSSATSHHPSYAAEAYNSVHQQQQMENMKAAERQQQMGDSMPPPSRVNPGEKGRVVELTDSLNKLKTKAENGADFDESTDTMGTIEPLPLNASRDTSAFSGVSLTSSTFSLINGSLDSNRLDSTKSIDAQTQSVKTRESGCNSPRAPTGARGLIEAQQATIESFHQFDERPSLFSHDPRRASINVEDKDFFLRSSGQRRSSQKLDSSMSLSQVWKDDKRQNFINHAIREGQEDEEHDSRKQSQRKPPHDPRPVDIMDDEPDNMSVLGKSSMSILNIAMGESVDSAMLTAPNESIFSDIGD